MRLRLQEQTCEAPLVDFGSASARLAMRFIRLVIGRCAGDIARPSEDTSEKRQLRSHGGALFRAKEEWVTRERVRLCAVRQELPVLEGKACPGDTSCHLSVLSFK